MRHPHIHCQDSNILHGFGDHAPGYGAGLIVILFKNGLHPVPYLGIHISLIVEHPRNSGDRGPCLGCNVINIHPFTPFIP